MGGSDSEKELKKKKKEKKDKGSGDEKKEKRDREKEERKEGMDREKEERKAKADREKEERKAQKDKEKEQRDKEKEERKGKLDKKKEDRDREKEERKERKDKEKEGKDKDSDEKKKHRDDFKHGHKHESDPSHPSGSGGHGGPADVHGGKAADHHNASDTHSRPPLPEEIPWFLREPGSVPTYEQSAHIGHGPSIQSPPPQYSIHPPPPQPPLRTVNDGAVPPVQNVPPSGHRIPLSPNVQFPVPDRLGRPPATDFDGSTPVFIGSAIFPNSVHPCRIVPSLQSPCRVLCEGSEVEHHGRYDLLPVTDDMEWVSSKNGEIPPGRRPVEGGYESNVNKLYHALGFVQGIYIPGKAGQHLRGAIVPFGGTEHHLPDNYSVLCWK